MDLRASMNSFMAKHGAHRSDFVSRPEIKAAAVGAGVFAVSTAAGYGLGRQHGIDNYGPKEIIDVQRSYFVKTGREMYRGRCSAVTSGGEFITFDCPKFRDVGYYQSYTTQENARSHFALKGAGIGAAVGAVGGVLAAVATYVLTRD